MATQKMGRMTTAENEYQAAHARISSLKWPRWPYLPMKRGDQNNDLGFLYADNATDQDGVKLYRVNLFAYGEMKPEERAAVEVLEYPTVGALLNDGWRID